MEDAAVRGEIGSTPTEGGIKRRLAPWRKESTVRESREQSGSRQRNGRTTLEGAGGKGAKGGTELSRREKEPGRTKKRRKRSKANRRILKDADL